MTNTLNLDYFLQVKLGAFAPYLTNPTMRLTNIPQCAIFNRNVHICAHFGYKMVYCGIWDSCIMGFVRQVRPGTNCWEWHTWPVAWRPPGVQVICIIFKRGSLFFFSLNLELRVTWRNFWLTKFLLLSVRVCVSGQDSIIRDRCLLLDIYPADHWSAIIFDPRAHSFKLTK